MSTRQQAEAFPGRTFYAGKGVNWSRFLLWLFPVFIVVAILAEIMAQLYVAGHYLIFIVPFAAALAVAGMMNLAVNKGHCRSAIVSGLAGFCAGLALYMGYFYLGMIHDFGPEIIGHPEALPTYIHLRMEVQKTHDVNDAHSEDDNKMPTSFDVAMNWVFFAFEFGLVLVMTTGAGLRRARKPYCESCQRWMVRDFTQFDPGSADELLDALRVHSARSLAALSAGAPFATIPNVSLAADYCPSLKDGVPRDCPVYVSVKNINSAPKQAALDTFEQSKGKLLVRGLQLNTDELAALAPRFKIFETLTGRSAVAALLPSEPPEEPTENKDLVYAEITPLTDDHAGKVLTRKNILIMSAISLLVLAGFFAGMGLMLGGIFLAFPDHPPIDGVSPTEKTCGLALIVFGGIWFLFSIGIALVNPSYFGTRFFRKLHRNELARRIALMVDANDPEALFVEIVPKLNWGKVMLENASDLGLLVVDRSKRQLRFEGDKERWRIPAAAIVSCQIEIYVHRQGNSSTKIYYVTVRANHRNGFWEAPIRERIGYGLLSRRRKKSAEELFQAIESIRGK